MPAVPGSSLPQRSTRATTVIFPNGLAPPSVTALPLTIQLGVSHRRGSQNVGCWHGQPIFISRSPSPSNQLVLYLSPCAGNPRPSARVLPDGRAVTGYFCVFRFLCEESCQGGKSPADPRQHWRITSRMRSKNGAQTPPEKEMTPSAKTTRRVSKSSWRAVTLARSLGRAGRG